MAGILIPLLNIAYQVIEYGILAYVILSWFVRPNTKLAEFYMFLARFFEPIMGPVRRLMQPLTYRLRIDFSPWVTIILVRFVYRFLYTIIYRTAYL